MTELVTSATSGIPILTSSVSETPMDAAAIHEERDERASSLSRTLKLTADSERRCSGKPLSDGDGDGSTGADELSSGSDVVGLTCGVTYSTRLRLKEYIKVNEDSPLKVACTV